MKDSFQKIEEGKAQVSVPCPADGGVVSRKLPVFYNPLMKFNRDTSIWVLNAVSGKDLQIALPLAGSGVRAVRFLKELDKGKIKKLCVNDVSEKAIGLIKKNLDENNCEKENVELHNEDANLFLLKSPGFDYIDIDPFGSPNPFLQSAVVRLSRGGILAVTATDTSALCGSYPRACMRKYWSKPMRNELMHEIGLRILIRRVQLIGANADKALTPIMSYAKDHYMRVFFSCEKGKMKVNDIIKKHSMFSDSYGETAGPLWTGQLADRKLCGRMLKKVPEDDDSYEFIKILSEELNTLGFFDLHAVAKKAKIRLKKTDEVIGYLIKKGFKISKTHFSRYGIKTDANLEDVIEAMK